MKQARGMRNNNPLNIIKSEKINWQGEVKPSTDPNFAQFETLEYGLTVKQQEELVPFIARGWEMKK